MKKLTISKLFLYRYRFIIGYIVLGLAFAGLLIAMPIFAQRGLSEAEINSATTSYYLGKNGLFDLNFVDLPYHLLQKLSITLFGLSAYTVKLPSIILGLLLGFLLILLLNRWFKNNVSLLASCLIVLSTPFLFLAGSGTPLIMLVFWPTLLLWLGSKIQGEKHPRPRYCFMFIIAMLASIFTPFMIYFVISCVFFVMMQPHLRFIVKSLPRAPLITCIVIALVGFGLLGVSVVHQPLILKELFFSKTFIGANFLGNLGTGLAQVSTWHTSTASVLLTPLISLPTFALALVGLFSTTKGFFASRNSIATILIVFCLIITGFNPDAIMFCILPLSILIAHGIKYLLEKWYGLFPENPYARILALLPLGILFGFIIIPELLHYFYGYRHNPNLADEFSDELSIVSANLTDEHLLVTKHYDFYKILEDRTDITVIDKPEPARRLAVLGTPDFSLENYTLTRIITSPKRNNSDILYIYTSEEGE